MDPSPTIVFTADLSLLSTEAIGPFTNTLNPKPLHPDQHDNSPDRGRAATAVRAGDRSMWVPGLTAAENIQLKNSGTVTLHGLKAIYVRDNYCSNAVAIGATSAVPADRAWLTGVVS